MNSKRSGSCHLAYCLERWSRSSSPLASWPSRRTITASGRSPQRSSGIAITAASATDSMGHQLVLEVDGGDPLAARLDQILGAVTDPQVAVLVDRDHVSGHEPTVLGELLRALTAVVGARDPRPTHLELPHRRVIPRDQLAVLAARADLDERRCESLPAAVLVTFLLAGAIELERQAADAAQRRGLGHPPRMDDRQAMAVKTLDQALGCRRAADDQLAQGAQVPAIGLGVKRLQHRHPDRRHASGHRDAFIGEQIEHADRVELGARKHQARRRSGWPCTRDPTRWRGTSAPPVARCRAD